MINYIFAGNRATGKTCGLFKRAEECVAFGKTPVIIGQSEAILSRLANKALGYGYAINQWVFLTYEQYREHDVIPNAEIFIDELEYFVSSLFGDALVNVTENRDDFTTVYYVKHD